MTKSKLDTLDIIERDIYRLTVILKDTTYSSNKEMSLSELLMYQEKQRSISKRIQGISQILERSEKITKKQFSTVENVVSNLLKNL